LHNRGRSQCPTPDPGPRLITPSAGILFPAPLCEGNAHVGSIHLNIFSNPFSERHVLASVQVEPHIAILVATMVYLVGAGPLLLVQLPITVLAASIGVWLFYVQHQFEDTFWADDEGWNFQDAALHGSSHYDLPSVLRWFTANIGVHHVHHLCSRIPYYWPPQSVKGSPGTRCGQPAYPIPEPPMCA
jgi:hypothetical protein